MKYDAVEQARDYLLEHTGAAPHLAMIMGIGLSAVDEILRDTIRIHYVTIPHFPVPKVAGHRGQAVFGKIGNLNVMVFEGRVHHYEGYSTDEIAFCTRVIGSSGARTVLLTNAAGAVNPDFARGQLMMMTDHINLMGVHPLVGPNEDRWGPRFVDQTDVYDAGLREKLRNAAAYCGVRMVQGVYAALSGPTYETPAEVRYLRTIGADAAGMSTVPEAIVARHMGMKVAGISLLTNVAGGQAGKPVDHSEVLAVATQLNADIGMVLQRFFETYDE